MITAEITVGGSITAEVTINSSVNITTEPFIIVTQSMTPGQVTQIDTGQLDRKPRSVSFYDEVNDENINHSIPGWTARQNGNWFIDVPSHLKTYTNITVSWL